MDLMYYILSPFSWLLNFFYSFTQSYGISLIFFALVVKVILFPLTIKGKKSMIQMNLLSGKMQQLQKQYSKDQQRYQQEMAKLYEREKVNPMGGCLWTMVPMFILIPLYFIIREPLKYLMGLTAEQIEVVASTLNWSTVAVEKGWVREAGETFASTLGAYNQMFLASLINGGNLSDVVNALGEGTRVFAMNFNFLGLDLSMIPTWKIWENPSLPVIAAFILVLISASSSILMSKITTMTNQMNTNQELSEQAKNTNRTMMLIAPLMSLWIGFAMPVALCIYWISNSVFSTLQELVAGRILKKDYEAARLAAEEQARLDKEEEKRRKEEARLERERRLAEEKKNKGKKKPGQKKAVESGVDKSASREGLRAYARGRAYDPNRFGGVTPYHDPNGPAKPEPAEEEPEDVTAEEKPSLPIPESMPEPVLDTSDAEEELEDDEADGFDGEDLDDDDDDDKESV